MTELTQINVAQPRFYTLTAHAIHASSAIPQVYETFFLGIDMNTKCEFGPGSTYAPWFAVGILAFLFYVIGLPVVLSVFLYRYRKKLNGASTRHLFGFLYNGYEPDFYWWEVWVIVRKSLLMAMAVFMVRKDEYNYLLSPESQNDSIQLLACTAVMAIIVVSHLVTRPYEADSLDVLELLALFAVFITYLAALAFATIDGFKPTKDQQWGEGGAGLLLTLVVVLAHVVFAVYMIYLLLVGTGHKLDTMGAKEHIERVKKTKNPRPWIRLSLTKDKKQLKKLKKKRVNPAAVGPAPKQPAGEVPDVPAPEQKEDNTDLEAGKIPEQTQNGNEGKTPNNEIKKAESPKSSDGEADQVQKQTENAKEGEKPSTESKTEAPKTNDPEAGQQSEQAENAKKGEQQNTETKAEVQNTNDMHADVVPKQTKNVKEGEQPNTETKTEATSTVAKVEGPKARAGPSIPADDDDDAIERYDAGIQYDKSGKPKVELDDDGNVQWRVGMAVECCCTIVPTDRLGATIRNPWLKGKVIRLVSVACTCGDRPSLNMYMNEYILSIYGPDDCCIRAIWFPHAC